MKIVEVNKIWDNALHNAFTDLIYYNNQWLCTFREGQDHICDEGKIQILSSSDTKVWKSVALLSWEEGDLRDPKFSVTPNNELMLNGAIRFVSPKEGNNHQSVTWFSKDGEHWSEGYTCSSGLGTWRWSATWHKDKVYSFAYTGKDKEGCLYVSSTGKEWSVLKDDVFPNYEAKGNESSIVFKDDVAYCLLRRDKGDYTAMLGHSKAPYSKWEWKNLGGYIGGPKMILIDNERFLGAGRVILKKKARTSLFWINPLKAKASVVLTLPSGGDCSYPGVVYQDGFIYVGYYSSHEGKSAIYFAKVQLTWWDRFKYSLFNV